MAQRVNIELIDDLDQSSADETVRFGIDGADYEIDLSAKNAAKLRDSLSGYVEAGRRLSGRRRGGRSAGRSGNGPSAAEIRSWARENGWDVPERGRVAAEVREAYDAAH